MNPRSVFVEKDKTEHQKDEASSWTRGDRPDYSAPKKGRVLV